MKHTLTLLNGNGPEILSSDNTHLIRDGLSCE